MKIIHAWLNHQSFIVILTTFMITGCSLLKNEEKEPRISLQTVDITLDADANNDTATAIDLIIFYKADLLKALMKTSSAQYFATAEQIRRDYPHMIDVWHWELAPSQTITDYPITLRDEPAAGALVFARYNSPGEHRIRVGSFDNIIIRLKKNDFCILEQGCDSSNQSVQNVSAKSTLEQNKVEAIKGTFHHEPCN